MKKMKKSEKVFRTLLIAAMGVALTGVTLATAFATYEIKIEHIFQDHDNGTSNLPTGVSSGEYTPRDDLIDSLGDGGLSVEVEGSTTKDEDGNDVRNETAVITDGKESGNDVGVKQAVDIANKLLDQLEGQDGNTNPDVKEKLENIKNKVDALDGQNPDDMNVMDENGEEVAKYPIKEQPAGEKPPVVPEEPKAKVEDPGAIPEPPARNEGESDEDYNARFQEFQETTLKEYNEKYEAYTADQARLKDEQEKYDAAVEAWEKWDKDWKDWEAYQEAKAAYLDKLDEISKELRDWITNNGGTLEGLDYSQLTDKALKESYQQAYLEVCKELNNLFSTKQATNDDGTPKVDENGEPVMETVLDVSKLKDVKAALGNIYSPVLSGEVEVNTWQAPKQEYETGEDNINLFEFEAWLSDESKKTLEAAGYHSDKSPFKITVVGIAKDGTEVTYISKDGGENWYKSDDLDEKGDPKNGVSSADTKAIVKDGYVTNAITFTFLHEWTPEADKPTYPGENVEVTPPPAPTSTPTPTPTPTPSTSVPPSETPIDEPETPLDEPDIPLDEVELPLEEIPLTGDISYLWYAAALISAAGLLFLVYRNKETA